MTMIVLIVAAVGTILPCLAVWAGDARARRAHS
jgi:hypothetical protein